MSHAVLAPDGPAARFAHLYPGEGKGHLLDEHQHVLVEASKRSITVGGDRLDIMMSFIDVKNIMFLVQDKNQDKEKDIQIQATVIGMHRLLPRMDHSIYGRTDSGAQKAYLCLSLEIDLESLDKLMSAELQKDLLEKHQMTNFAEAVYNPDGRHGDLVLIKKVELVT